MLCKNSVFIQIIHIFAGCLALRGAYGAAVTPAICSSTGHTVYIYLLDKLEL